VGATPDRKPLDFLKKKTLLLVINEVLKIKYLINDKLLTGSFIFSLFLPEPFLNYSLTHNNNILKIETLT